MEQANEWELGGVAAITLGNGLVPLSFDEAALLFTTGHQLHRSVAYAEV